ncbi:hypothetical protein CLG85_009490 [Yangia mangrovi]|uniref:Uncharacterized protein n=1 Tax=Alloyangia mangrovi TaxID=1779329 RepID=A0ABT2KJL2_9RHOB|nr:hypothetical protein [Alloyangia mangrovi]MCT4370540.1 hypothetical protein [Alloyangia mangrovi]
MSLLVFSVTTPSITRIAERAKPRVRISRISAKIFRITGFPQHPSHGLGDSSGAKMVDKVTNTPYIGVTMPVTHYQ